jgi:hypothetical protein
MGERFKKIIASLLIWVYTCQVTVVMAMPMEQPNTSSTPPTYITADDMANQPITTDPLGMNSLTLSSNNFGWTGPLLVEKARWLMFLPMNNVYAGANKSVPFKMFPFQ